MAVVLREAGTPPPITVVHGPHGLEPGIKVQGVEGTVQAQTNLLRAMNTNGSGERYVLEPPVGPDEPLEARVPRMICRRILPA